MKKIVYFFPTNRQQLTAEVEKGTAPDNNLYGFNHLQKFFNIEQVETPSIFERILNLLLLPMVYIFNSRYTKLNVGRVIVALPRLRRVDAVISCVDSVNKVAALFKKLHFFSASLICMAGNVMDGTEKFLRLHQWLWSGADRIITHAPVDQEKLVKLGLGDRGVVIPVGSDRGFWQKVRLPRPTLRRSRNDSYGLVVSVGADRDRDYRTLFSAAAQLPKLRLLVCCGQKNIEGLEIPNNVEVKINVPPKETRAILLKAGMVVLPLRETYRASGQLALLDAMLMKKPVIVSKTRGVVEPYGLENGKQALLPFPGNVESLVQAIKELQGNVNLRRRLRIAGRKLAVRYTTKKYAEELKKVIFASS